MPKVESVRQVSARRLMLLSGLLPLLPAVLFGAYALSRLIHVDQQTQRERLAQAAHAIMVAVDRELASMREVAQVLASARQLASGNVAAFDDLAHDAAASGKYEVVLLDENGHQLINTRIEPGRPLPVTQNLDSVRKVFETGEPVVTGLLRATSTGHLTLGVDVPVRIDGRIKFALYVAANIARFTELVQRAALPDGWIAAIDDPMGMIIARSQGAGQYVGTRSRLQTPGGGTGTVSFTDLEGRPSIMTYAVSPETGYRAVVWVTEATFFSSTRTLELWFGGMAAAALTLTLAAGTWSGMLLSSPIRRIAECADRLRDGKPVHYHPSIMREANVAGVAMEDAAKTIALREASLGEEMRKTNLLMAELAHRTKNVMAVVSAVARQSAKSSTSVDDFFSRFDGRLAGFSRSLDLLVQADWQGVPLRNLIESQLSSFVDARRIELDGPELLLTPQAAQHIGMALHELATNAIKYGALSERDGIVSIGWRREGDVLELTWKERNGPPVEKPERKGFGQVVIEDMVRHSLDGETELVFERDGLRWSFRAPLELVTGSHTDEVARAGPRALHRV